MPRVVTLGTIRLMRVWRPTTAVRRSEALDAALALLGAGLIAFAAWAPSRVAGTALQGPLWLRAVLPFLLGVPLAVRRRCPLLVWALIWAGVCLAALVAREAPAVLGVTVVLLVGSYSLGAYGSNRRALVGLVVAVAGVAISTTSADGWSGQLVVGGYEVVEYASGIPVLVAGFFAFWVAGVVVGIRRDAAALAVRNEALDRAAERAGVAERARIAREMHDILAHHLSVVVLQAAGACAAGSPSLETLEKIEHSGRQALAETRRLLGVLRGPDDGVELAPQPGIAALPALMASVRQAGLPVSLAVDGERAQLPGAVDVSAYRIVQEALTNVLKHAGPARARVQIDCSRDAVAVEVRDDGSGVTGNASEAGGRGLLGIRERVAVLGGELRAGPESGGGFTVRATLPLGCRPAGDGGWA
jgi:signal transduction histidine kinase